MSPFIRAGGLIFWANEATPLEELTSLLSEVQINCEHRSRSPGAQWPVASLATWAGWLGVICSLLFNEGKKVQRSASMSHDSERPLLLLAVASTDVHPTFLACLAVGWSHLVVNG